MMGSEKNVLFILPNRDFRDEEFAIPRDYFEESGIGYKIAAGQPGDCMGIGGALVSADHTFDDVEVAEFDAVLFVGGIGVEQYFDDEGALKLAYNAHENGILVCASGWAPVVLAHAGILKDRRVAVIETGKKEIDLAGAQYTGEEITIDGNIITAQDADYADMYAQKIIDMISL